MGKHSPRTVSGVAALAILVVLGAVGLWLGTPLTGRTAVRIPVAEVATSIMKDTPAPHPVPHPVIQRVIAAPPGYPEGSCQPSANPSPDAVAAEDCVNNTLPGGPPFARYEVFADQNTLNNAFQTDVGAVAPQPCPGAIGSAPAPWNAASPPPASGLVMCYIGSDNMAHVEWTNTTDLLRANASGPDLASLYGWFQGLLA